MSNEHGTVTCSPSDLLPVLVDTNGKSDISHSGKFGTAPVSTMHHDSHDRSYVDNIREIKSPIYRYEFTEEFMGNLYQFSKIHQYDDRHAFKESWELWTQENNEVVNQEIIRLQELQYDGDILDKMFKSARYYFRKKGTEKKTPKERKTYVSLSRKMLDCMDEHILLNTQNVNVIKPSDCFVDFCQNNKEMLREMIQLLNQEGIQELEEIQNKVKKTYKNRYFTLKTRLFSNK